MKANQKWVIGLIVVVLAVLLLVIKAEKNSGPSFRHMAGNRSVAESGKDCWGKPKDLAYKVVVATYSQNVNELQQLCRGGSKIGFGHLSPYWLPTVTPLIHKYGDVKSVKLKSTVKLKPSRISALAEDSIWTVEGEKGEYELRTLFNSDGSLDGIEYRFPTSSDWMDVNSIAIANEDHDKK